MNNSKRVFANNNDISYIEYMDNLRGGEIYKTAVLNRLPEDKHNLFRIKGNELTNFINHETFLNVTKSFYKYNQPYEVYDERHPPVSIQDGAKSHIDYEVLLSHIKDCDYCCRCKNITEIYECNELKNFLYPYGTSDLIKYPIFRFPLFCSGLSSLKSCYSIVYAHYTDFFCFQTLFMSCEGLSNSWLINFFEMEEIDYF